MPPKRPKTTQKPTTQPTRKMKNVSFITVEEFLDFLPEKELRITTHLRNLILDCLPMVKERLSYNVPFYSGRKTICFIWPASILWGQKQSYEGVRFGFTSGHLLHDENNYLSKENPKQVYWRDFADIKEIDIDLVKSYIFEAAIIDEENHKNKKEVILVNSLFLCVL